MTAPPASRGAAARGPASRGAAQAPPEQGGRLLVRSTPAGARVFVDGRDYGPSPAEVRGLLHGAHTVRLVGDGFVPIERQIVITAAQPALNITIPLGNAPVSIVPQPPAPPPQPGAVEPLRVESRPSGAAVFVDGRPVGTTPMVVPGVPLGTHEVRLELDGYRPWTATTTVEAGGDNRVTGSLER